jgi:DNA-binding CsgD family transcriptional regulator
MAVILTDARGRIVDRRGVDRTLVACLGCDVLAPGFIHTEQAVGTNAVGSALALRRPASVEGAEHYADALTAIAGAAAPVRDPRTGHMLGVVGLVAPEALASALMLPLAIQAAREIEHRLVDGSSFLDRVVFQRFVQERRTRAAFVFLTERAIVTNTTADRLIKGADETVLRQCAARARHGQLGQAEPVVLSDGSQVTVRWEPLLDGGSEVGTVLQLRPRVEPGSYRTPARNTRAAFGWSSLTGTEHRVTELVAQGLTNREAAERLFLSHHTVGFHLRSIYCKLGVKSRVELTRLAVEQVARPEPNACDHRALVSRT